ncbi:hypothetical protein ONZ45_g8384 [Pleurotus djamor]|nr:hypothetical protein ONZ45_g8384 [Pleurotus djamor]
MSDRPLLAHEKKAIPHAILCTIGFLIILPIGSLVARYLRTFTHNWFWFHAIWQFLVGGPIIFAGWALGRETTNLLQEPHYNDPHKKTGLALLILYILQLTLGAVIHWYKPTVFFKGVRPPQNYLHAVLGLIILALAAYQVHYGLNTEWLLTGNFHAVPQSAKNAWEALIILFWILYPLGLFLLPRQFTQERAYRRAVHSEKDGQSDHIQLQSSSS